MISQILKDAQAKISKPEHWCQDAWARNFLGTKTNGNDFMARSFCAAEAIAIAANANLENTTKAIKYFRTVAKSGCIAYNDAKGRTHDEIMNIFDEAIELAESEEN